MVLPFSRGSVCTHLLVRISCCTKSRVHAMYISAYSIYCTIREPKLLSFAESCSRSEAQPLQTCICAPKSRTSLHVCKNCTISSIEAGKDRQTCIACQ